jgi:hypothetical protein
MPKFAEDTFAILKMREPFLLVSRTIGFRQQFHRMIKKTPRMSWRSLIEVVRNKVSAYGGCCGCDHGAK